MQAYDEQPTVSFSYDEQPTASYGRSAGTPTRQIATDVPARARRLAAEWFDDAAEDEVDAGGAAAATAHDRARALDFDRELAAQRAGAPNASATEPPDAPELDAAGVAGIDPHEVPTPPELAPTIYGWLRRLALQTDLAGADRLLREALAELAGALAVVPYYPSEDGAHALGPDDPPPADRRPFQVVGQTRRALVASHTALLPVATATETVAIVQVTKNPRQPGFTPAEVVVMIGLVRECAGVLHHLVLAHRTRERERAADQASLYRPEALEHHRRRGQEGALAELSPGWVRRTYYVLAAAIAIALAFSVLIEIPTYSSGTGIVMFDGTPITTPMAGTVDHVYVQSGQEVRAGDLLVKLASAKEDADLTQARTELATAEQQYLFEPADEAVRKSLVGAQAAVKRAEAAVAERAVRASVAGTISDIRIRAGTALQFGEPILTIVEPGAEPTIWAYLPGSDRPRLRPRMALQVELVGFTKARETAQIVAVGREVIGTAEARRSLGAEIADALQLAANGSYVLVKARLPARTFRAGRRTYHYHQGMPAKTEVRVESKPFLVTLLPALDAYL